MQTVNLEQIKGYIQLLAQKRPAPRREYDQIYMFDDDMQKQVLTLMGRTWGKNVVFMGDGDGMSILLALATKDAAKKPKSITVFDFDERILNNYSQMAKENGLTNFFCKRYNVIDPLPKTEIAKYDYFCINPPYASKNMGLSCILWLHRCLAVCKNVCEGCIVYPTSGEENWIEPSNKKLWAFFKEAALNVVSVEQNMHMYHLPDNPNLKSSSIFVENKNNNPKLKWQNEKFSEADTKNLYGSQRKLPHYIIDDNTAFGKLDMDW